MASRCEVMYFIRQPPPAGPADRSRSIVTDVLWTVFEMTVPVRPGRVRRCGVSLHALSRQPYPSSTPLRRLRLRVAAQASRTSRHHVLSQQACLFLPKTLRCHSVSAVAAQTVGLSSYAAVLSNFRWNLKTCAFGLEEQHPGSYGRW